MTLSEIVLKRINGMNLNDKYDVRLFTHALCNRNDEAYIRFVIRRVKVHCISLSPRQVRIMFQMHEVSLQHI